MDAGADLGGFEESVLAALERQAADAQARADRNGRAMEALNRSLGETLARAVRAEEALRQIVGGTLSNMTWAEAEAVRKIGQEALAAAGADTPPNQREDSDADDSVNRAAAAQTDAGAEVPQRVPPPSTRRATALHPNASGAPTVSPLGEPPVAGADTGQET